jgi:hypothetical protein
MPRILLRISKQAILLYIILLSGTTLFFASHALPLIWIMIGAGTVFFSFFYFSRLSIKWANLSERIFRKRIFWTALWIRVGYVFASYFFYLGMTGTPFEFGAADSAGYHYQGLRIAEYLRMGEFDLTPLIYFEKTASRGIMILMGFVYALFFDSIIAFRIVNSLLGAWACVLIYDIARRSFDLNAARISAVMAVVAPPLIYYCGLHLKEAVIVFLVVFFINIGDRLLKARQFSVLDMTLLIGGAGLMFLFRNALAIALIVSCIAAAIFLSRRVSLPSKRYVVGFVLICVFIGFSQVDLTHDVERETMYYFGLREIHIEHQMTRYATREGGNLLATYATRAVFAPLGFVGSLPTLVEIPQQEDIMMRAGSMFFRNVFIFFALYSLYFMFRQRQWRSHVLLLAVFFSWLFILANSGYALQDRFHLILMPIVIILSGYGISMAGKKAMGNFSLYLLFLGALIFAWNLFKLAGRGWF